MGGKLTADKKPFSQCWHTEKPNDIRGEIPELTEREKEIIRFQWKTVYAKCDIVAVDIFCRIFELNPETKQFFPFKNAVGEALTTHPYFTGHAKRFLNGIRMTVINLDAWEVILIPNLLKLGQQHAYIKGFRHEYFEIFTKAMDYAWNKHLGKKYNSEARSAWTKIFKLIVSKVEQGYLEGMDDKIHRESMQVMNGTTVMKNKTDTAI